MTEEVEADNTVDVKKQDVTITKDADQKRYKVGDTVKYKVKVGLKKRKHNFKKCGDQKIRFQMS